MIRVIVSVVKNIRLLILAAALSFIAYGCQPKSQVIEPTINLVPAARNIDCLASAFPKLTEEEMSHDFGKELQIAIVFAKEFDLYRAITSYKRALILIPKKNIARVQQIEYSIIESYYLGMKYQEVIDTFEHSHLLDVRPDFPAIGQLLVILYDSYLQLGLHEKACRLLGIIEKGNDDVAKKLKGYVAFSNADFMEIQNLGFRENFLIPYTLETKSVKKAQILNAVLPGAGYYYIGQKKSAATSFIINTLFTAAAYQFFSRGYIAAGAITASFEAGWYFGGINGAGLEAKEYNERLYEVRAKDFMLKEKLFPILTFETSF
jgi:hypothetical protein